MDVGFNNTNTFETKELRDVEFIVEATSEEKFNLWKRYSRNRKSYIEKMIETPTIGELKLLYDNGFLSEELRKELALIQNTLILVEKHNRAVEEELKLKVDWEDEPMGKTECVGTYNGKQIWVSFYFSRINGHKVAFYECTSVVVNHDVVENYLMRYFQKTYDNYSRWCHTNATNFHNCICGLTRLDKEPRNTTFKDYHEI